MLYLYSLGPLRCLINKESKQYSGDLKSNHLKSGLFEGWISIGPVFKWLGFSYGYIYSPNHLKTRPFKMRMFLSWFQMTFDKMAAICSDFKWLGFRITDPIQNLDHLQPNFFSTIWNSDQS